MNAFQLLLSLTIMTLMTCIAAGDLCSSRIIAPDGSSYDMSPFQNQLHHVDGIGQDGQVYFYNISICGVLPTSCGYCRSSSACQIYRENLYGKTREVCLGTLNSRSTIKGLNNNKGVEIHYKDGENCPQCNPIGRHETKITLYCKDGYASNEIELESATVFEDDKNTLVQVEGSMSCNFNTHAMTQVSYYSYENLCNGTMNSIVKVKTSLVEKCQPGCRLQDNFSVYSTCIKKLDLPAGRWVQDTTYDNQWCDFPVSTEYRRMGACLGTTDFSYEVCMNGQVVWYDCGYDSSCSICVPKLWTATDTCLVESQLKCITKR